MVRKPTQPAPAEPDKKQYEIPTSIDQAAQYQRTMTTALCTIESREQILAEAKKRLDEDAELELAPLREEVIARAKALFAFAKKNREALTVGGKKSFLLPHAGEIGWYASGKGKVVIVGRKTKKKLEQIFEDIRKMGWTKKFIRMVPELNKEAMLFDERSRAQAARIPGIKILQGEFCELTPECDHRVVLDYEGTITIESKKKKQSIQEDEAA